MAPRVRLRVASALIGGLYLLAGPLPPALASAGEGTELLVRFRPAMPPPVIRRAIASEGAIGQEKLPLAGLRLVELAPGASLSAAIAGFERRRSVLFAEPNRRLRFFDTLPNDPRFGELWGLDNTGQTLLGNVGALDADVDAPAAWDLTTGSASTTAAVMDTGIALSHPDLDDNIWENGPATPNGAEIAGNHLDDDGNGYVDDVHGWDWSEDDNNPDDTPQDGFGHGTHLAGTIGAEGDNGVGVAGVNWDVSLMPLRLTIGDQVSDELQAIAYAKAEGARVVNMSFGGTPFSNAEKAAFAAASGVLFVAAAGNDGHSNDRKPIYPCGYALANLICVGATNHRDRLAHFSNFGPTSVDLAAPGTGILSTFPRFGHTLDLIDQFSKPLGQRWTTGGRGLDWARIKRSGGVLSDSPAKRYRNNTNSWARSRPINLTDRRFCALTFGGRLRTEPGDRLIVEASANGTRFRPLARYSGRRELVAFLHVPRRLYGDPSVFIRFRLFTDGSIRRDGVFIQSVVLDCSATRNTYAHLDGTSMSAPHVTGAAALYFALNPAATVADARAALFDVDPLPALAGKVATGGRLNLFRVLTP